MSGGTGCAIRGDSARQASGQALCPGPVVPLYLKIDPETPGADRHLVRRLAQEGPVLLVVRALDLVPFPGVNREPHADALDAGEVVLVKVGEGAHVARRFHETVARLDHELHRGRAAGDLREFGA